MTETIALWLPSLLISPIAVGAFLYLARQSRSQIDKLKSALRQSTEQSVEHFLQRESRSTLQRIQTSPIDRESVDPNRWLPHIRRCWLEAEMRSLVQGGQIDSDYDQLQEAVIPLLRMLRPKTADGSEEKAGWSGKISQEYLQKTRAAAASQRQFIQDFKARTAKLGKKPQKEAASTTEDPAASAEAGFIASMTNMESSTADLLQTIERLERELATAQSKYDVIKERLEALEAIRATRGAVAQATVRLTDAKSSNGNIDADRELLDDMESAYVNSINEMKKMGSINRLQRQQILQMEKELANLRKGSVEHHVANEALDKLKLQLRDYENCTTILEMESDTLREQIQKLRRAMSGTETIVDATPSNPQPAPASTQEFDLPALMSRLATAEDLESAGRQLVDWLSERHIMSVVFIKGEHEQIWISSEGRVDEHSKQLLKSMVPVAGQPISEVREGVLFLYATCRVLLYGKGDFHERGGNQQILLRDTFSCVDRMLQLFLDRLDLQQHHQQRAKLQQKIQSLLVQYNYIDAEFGRVLAGFRSELESYLATVDASDVQRSYIDTMQADFDSQLEILSKTGKLVANGLKVSVQDLAKIEKNTGP